jgi:hypothetical protein
MSEPVQPVQLEEHTRHLFQRMAKLEAENADMHAYIDELEPKLLATVQANAELLVALVTAQGHLCDRCCDPFHPDGEIHVEPCKELSALLAKAGGAP